MQAKQTVILSKAVMESILMTRFFLSTVQKNPLVHTKVGMGNDLT